MEDEATHIKKRLATMESCALSNNIIIKGIAEDEWEKESTTRNKIYSELTQLIETDGQENEDNPKKLKKAKRLEVRNCK